jgi:hypothetical protein
MSRFVDRGATVAAFVGIGMALTVAVSFLMVSCVVALVASLRMPVGVAPSPRSPSPRSSLP